MGETSNKFDHLDSCKKSIYSEIMNEDFIEIFEKLQNTDINPYYHNRVERNAFASEQLQKNRISSVLNLGGGGNRHLGSKLAKKIKVFEVDIQGDCDLKVNLDELEKLPFENDSYDVVCAFDVLEHLENFHKLNEEMYRVTKNYMLISLPNSAAEIFPQALKNQRIGQPNVQFGFFSKYYGLPVASPSDRHRWWMYFQDIIRYYYYFSKVHKAKLEFWAPDLNLKKKLFKIIFGKHLCYTFFCPLVWIKLSKDEV